MNAAKAREIMANYRAAYPEITEFWMATDLFNKMKAKLEEVNQFLKDNAPFDPGIDELLAEIADAKIDTSDIPEAGEE